jgi:hypothetical protein
MPLRVGIDPKKEIILILTDFYCAVQIPTFKPRLKD